jgi:uncharacterized FlgJ-related protein
MRAQDLNTILKSRFGALRWLLLLFSFTVAIQYLKNLLKSLQMSQTLQKAQQFKELLVSDYGFPETFAEIVVSQSAHETAGWSSAVYRSNKNGFGMRFPRIRKTTAIGEKGGYANYESVADSFKDIVLYLEYSRVPKAVQDSVSSYTQFLKMRKYYEDEFSNYADGVAAWRRQLFQN